MADATKTQSRRFPDAPSPKELPSVDQEILEFWKADGTFQASIDERPEDDQFVFYDGPPFANGLPHYGHLLTGFAKDVIPRYQTMKGKRVERRFGWDTHGLPAELAAEKTLGISGRLAVLDMGIDKFNEAARGEVMKYAAEWEDYVTRQARWVDFENDYKTLDITFMESCLWAFKQLWDKGVVYKDYRVVPYSWAVESPLSNFETRLDNSYRNRTDPAVTIGFKIAEGQGDLSGAQLLIWTTTPWTLPSNLAAAAGADITYVVMAKDGQRYILSANGVEKFKKQLEGAEQVGEVKGTDLAGLKYHPPFDYFVGRENAHQVLLEDFVVDEDGTGIVHLSPGFGEDDLNACRKAGIRPVVPVDAAGKYTSEVADYEGMLVFDANKPIIQRMKEEGKLFRHDTYDHNYPHCWRTDEPLIYKAVDSWYLRVSDYRDRMVELNQQINWAPGHVKDGIFGNWLAGAQDWNISRSRFWGTPIPVWVSDDPAYPRTDVYGSIEDLERDFGVKVTDLHRPFIDELTRPNPDDPTGKSTMRRVEDVFDVWFDSGSMPYAQVHYPFENKETFEQNFPADFIVEYVAQTRGWFYTLMVLSTMLFDRPPFKNAICHGVVLDENRQKLSKRLRNYPDPLGFFDEFGSDVMRWFLISSPVLNGGDLLVPKEGREIASVQREAIAPLLNAYSFFSLYANLEARAPQRVTTADDPLDLYILTKTGELAENVGAALDAYDIPKATRETVSYFDALTNWYIRRSRSRFWGAQDGASKDAAFDTLYTVLVQATRICAPLLPIISEKLYKALTGERSVHLTTWPTADEFPADHDLVRSMDLVRDACSAALAVRERSRLRVRLPLKTLTIVHSESAGLAPFKSLIADEINVRGVELSTDLDAYGAVQLRPDPKIGKRLGKAMKEVMGAAKRGEFELNADGTATVGGQTLSPNEFLLAMVTEEGSAAEPFAGTGAVVVDISVDEDQEREGLARDLIRAVQTARKDAGLEVSDRIALGVEGGPLVAAAVDAHGDFIKSEVLALSLTTAAGPGARSEIKLGGEDVILSVEKAA
ncbi:isoleucine--tRNA ligase [Maricaulaceae bacterium EIL42A08]|nr:isoleucine--tRNA ligase [Maricaulaceae bacterium EIL42A08]